LTRYNFDKGGSIFIFFHHYIQKRSAEEDGIKTNTSPQICCCTTLWSARWSTVQHYSTVNSVQSDEKRLITVNVHEEWCFFVFFSTQITFRHVFIMSAFGTYVFWVMNATGHGCVNCALFNAVPNVFLHNLKEWAMQQTKYCTNVIMRSESEAKDK